MEVVSLQKQSIEQRTWIEIAFALRMKARSTKREYERDLKRFLRWGGGYVLFSDDGARFLLATNYHTIEAYHEWLKRQPGVQPRSCVAGDTYKIPPLANSSIERYLSSLSKIFGRLARVGLIDKNPICLSDLELESPNKNRRRAREYISKQQVDSLFAACETIESEILRLRDIAFLEILFGGGLRLQEISNLKVSNLSSMVAPCGTIKGVWIVSPKGKIDRYQPLPDRVLEAIERYLAYRKSITKVSLSDQLLGGKRGSASLTLNSLYLRFKTIAKMAGIPHASPHSARHTAISNLYTATKDIALVQKFAGHKDVTTTMQYLHLQDDPVARAMKVFKYR